MIIDETTRRHIPEDNIFAVIVALNSNFRQMSATLGSNTDCRNVSMSLRLQSLCDLTAGVIFPAIKLPVCGTNNKVLIWRSLKCSN
jgi:hypothetical protein